MLNFLLFAGTYIASAFLALRWLPVFGFVLYEITYFYYPQARWWGYMVPSLSYSFYTVVVMGGAMLLYYKKTKENKALKSPQIIFIWLMTFLMFTTSFHAVLPIIHDDALVNYVKLAIIMTIAFKLICDSRDLKFAIWGYIFGSWYISYVTYQVGRNSGERVEGIGTVDSPDANGIAAAIAPSVVLILYFLWVSTNKFHKLIFAFAGIFVANAIVLINSRGAFLAVAVSVSYLMYHLFFSKFQRKNQKITVIGLMVLSLAGAVYVVDDGFIERMKTITSEKASTNKETGATRTEFWKAAWDMAKDHPMGTGVAGFQVYSPMYIDENINTGKSRNRAVHSTWFESLTELGYPGFFTFILMIISCFWCTRKARAKLVQENRVDELFMVRSIEAALLAYLIAMTFINRMRADILYWCIIYAAAAYNVYFIKPKLTLKSSS